MYSVTIWIKACCATAFCALLMACSAGNEQAPALSSLGKHPAEWLTKHRAEYRKSPDQCRECHGTDLKGGVVKIDCFNQGKLGQCHALDVNGQGHGPRSIIHPVPFKGTDALNKQHGALAKADLTICQDCHGTSGGAGSNPVFNAMYGALAAGCQTSGCHAANMAHPKPWSGHGSAGNQPTACALCHGATYGGGSGPACNSCHALLKGGSLPLAGQCNSCHSNSPASVIPAYTGSHDKHLALPELKGNCLLCHSGGGSNSALHQVYVAGRSAKMGLASVFILQNGAVPTYGSSAKTCANVSCHGGQVTPAWGNPGGVALACTACHTASGQYNSYASGKHAEHVAIQKLACTDCHDTALLKGGHFSNLSTATLNQPASGTLKSFLNYTKNSGITPATCAPGTVPAGSSVSVCHGGLRQW